LDRTGKGCEDRQDRQDRRDRLDRQDRQGPRNHGFFLFNDATTEPRAPFRNQKKKKVQLPLFLPVLPVFTALSGWLES
jgi:hypothetical protein